MPEFLKLVILPTVSALVTAIVAGMLAPDAVSSQWRSIIVIGALGLGLGGSLWLYRQQRAERWALEGDISRQRSEKAPKPEEAAAPITLPDGRIVVRETPAEILSRFKAMTQMERERAQVTYVGKWLSIEDNVSDVSQHTNHISVDVGSFGSFVSLNFRDGPWRDQLDLLRKGTHIYALGKIDFISGSGLQLEECELWQKGLF